MIDRPDYELVLPRPLWETALRDLLIHPGRVAVGTCRRNRHAGGHELLVESLETTDQPPSGAARPPLDDWIVLRLADRQAGDNLPAWLEQLQPRRTQLLAVGLLGIGADRTDWNGAVIENGQHWPLQAIRIVGPGMLRASRDPASSPPEAADWQTRWSRTRGALGDAVWSKVAASRVLLIGAGRNGSALAYQLVALGIRSLVLVDPDRLGLENLDAGYGVTELDIGRPKTDALQVSLHAFRTDCSITSLPYPVTHPAVISAAAGADLIVTCVDHDTPRLAATRLARRLLKVHLDIGTGVTQSQEDGQRMLAGDVRLLLPQLGCVCCVGGLADEAEARYELAAPPGALPRRPPQPWHRQRAGSLITLNAMTVATGVQLWLDLLGGQIRTSHWTRLRWQPGQGIGTDTAPVGPTPDCPICMISAQTQLPPRKPVS